MSSLRFNLDESDLDTLAQRGDEAVLLTEVPADLLTPLSVFLQIAEPGGHSFLLESVEGGSSLARYSFLGSDAGRVFRIRDGALTVQESDGDLVNIPGPPLAALREERERRRPAPQTGLPPLSGGLVGFFSYDLVRLMEDLPTVAHDALGIPQAVLAEYRTVMAFDHLRNRLMLMTAVDLGGGNGERRASLRLAKEHLEKLAGQLQDKTQAPAAMTAAGTGEPQAAPSEEKFQEQVKAAQKAILEGEIFQVVLSRRFTRSWSGSPLLVYRRLRSQNPSPYHFLLACDGDYLVGASPEMLARVQGETVHARPIAGTRPRGQDENEDLQLEEELRTDAKENAEHFMLVDLARNDVGRVSRPGTVAVERFASVERYSHVMHLVSSVAGKLKPECDALDAFTACFPAGTLTERPRYAPWRSSRPANLLAAAPMAGRWDTGIAVAIWTPALPSGRL